MIHLQDFIFEILENNCTRYSGGRAGSVSAVVDNPRSTFYLEIDYDSEEECRLVEDSIKPLMDVFHPRVYRGSAHV